MSVKSVKAAMKKIILASASPRRREILELTGLKFTVCVSEYEEDMGLNMNPRALARFLSGKKAEEVARKFSNALVIGADTFIVYQGDLLGKPHTPEQCEKMLTLLNGKTHDVITGYTVIDTQSGKRLSRSIVTKVHFKKLALKEIRAYIKTGEPLDKAGAYAIQGLGAGFVEGIEGDYLNVVGLPLFALCESLKGFGVNVSGVGSTHFRKNLKCVDPTC